MRYSLQQVKAAQTGRLNISNIILTPIYDWSAYLFANLTNLTPNTITTFSLVFGIISAILFLREYFILGALAWTLRHILDDVDGRIARLKDLKSKIGHYYDSMASYIATLLVLAAFFISAGEKFLLVLIPFLILMFFLFPLQHITLNILIYKTRKREYTTFMDYCDLRRIAFILLPLFHSQIQKLPITLTVSVILLTFLAFIKQTTWIFYYSKEFKEYHVKNLENIKTRY